MKSRRERDFLERTAELFDLPGEVVAGISSITVTGDSRVFIDGHRGVAEYGDRCVSVRCGKQLAVVEGRELEIKAMSRRELLVTGKIAGVFFRSEPKGGRGKT